MYFEPVIAIVISIIISHLRIANIHKHTQIGYFLMPQQHINPAKKVKVIASIRFRIGNHIQYINNTR